MVSSQDLWAITGHPDISGHANDPLFETDVKRH